MEQHVNRDSVQVFQFGLDGYAPHNFGWWNTLGPDLEATVSVDAPNLCGKQLSDKGVPSRKTCNQKRIQQLSLDS
jgi:hypothetical protein